MKLFFISPLILFAFWKYEKPTIIIAIVFIIRSWYHMQLIITERNIGISNYFDIDLEQMNVIYFSLIIKGGSWLFGILVGNFLFKNRNKEFQIPKVRFF